MRFRPFLSPGSGLAVLLLCLDSVVNACVSCVCGHICEFNTVFQGRRWGGVGHVVYCVITFILHLHSTSTVLCERDFESEGEKEETEWKGTSSVHF